MIDIFTVLKWKSNMLYTLSTLRNCRLASRCLGLRVCFLVLAQGGRNDPESSVYSLVTGFS